MADILESDAEKEYYRIMAQNRANLANAYAKRADTLMRNNLMLLQAKQNMINNSIGNIGNLVKEYNAANQNYYDTKINAYSAIQNINNENALSAMQDGKDIDYIKNKYSPDTKTLEKLEQMQNRKVSDKIASLVLNAKNPNDLNNAKKMLSMSKLSANKKLTYGNIIDNNLNQMSKNKMNELIGSNQWKSGQITEEAAPYVNKMFNLDSKVIQDYGKMGKEKFDKIYGAGAYDRITEEQEKLGQKLVDLYKLRGSEKLKYIKNKMVKNEYRIPEKLNDLIADSELAERKTFDNIKISTSAIKNKIDKMLLKLSKYKSEKKQKGNMLHNIADVDIADYIKKAVGKSAVSKNGDISEDEINTVKTISDIIKQIDPKGTLDQNAVLQRAIKYMYDYDSGSTGIFGWGARKPGFKMKDFDKDQLKNIITKAIIDVGSSSIDPYEKEIMKQLKDLQNQYEFQKAKLSIGSPEEARKLERLNWLKNNVANYRFGIKSADKTKIEETTDIKWSSEDKKKKTEETSNKQKDKERKVSTNYSFGKLVSSGMNKRGIINVLMKQGKNEHDARLLADSVLKQRKFNEIRRSNKQRQLKRIYKSDEQIKLVKEMLGKDLKKINSREERKKLVEQAIRRKNFIIRRDTMKNVVTPYRKDESFLDSWLGKNIAGLFK